MALGKVQMMDAGLVDRVAAHQTLAAAPREELAWLVAHGTLERFAAGEIVSHKGQPVDELYIVLSGAIAHHLDRGGGRKKVMDWRAGDVTGLLPYSRLRTAPGDSIVEQPAEVLSVHRKHIPEMIRECPNVTAALVHVMLDRARVFNASDLHDEKMVSLGRLAAGLAHELNNPASAAVRSAKLLPDALAEADEAARALGAAALTATQRAALDRVRALCLASPVTSVLSPIERADREDTITTWLEGHGGDQDAAAPLAETPLTLDALEALARELDGDALHAALRWLGAGCAARALASDVERGAGRIHDLVSAVKRFTYMDQATVKEPVDVGQGLADTLAVLASKARAKSVAVSVVVPPDLPRVPGFGGELNQVWVNLVDNALDAVGTAGRVEVSARVEGGEVVVRVTDNGPGIPAEHRSRIFDPFFTTKPVGQGTGLGLDIVQKLVRRHDGEIDVESEAGRTRFSVRLPVAAERPAAGTR
ncbi:MAG TPA: ATP-binding protein [Gemmatimonadaceae bacterium]|nr:ATP-binding protein [Gemmatimonadaceae bacterium]